MYTKACERATSDVRVLTLVEPQSHFGDKPVKFQVVCPQNGTAVLKGLSAQEHMPPGRQSRSGYRYYAAVPTLHIP